METSPDILMEFEHLKWKYQPNSLDFQHCMGYVAQATRNGLFGVVQNDTAVVYTKRTADPDSEPVIVASSGMDTRRLIVETAQRLAEESEEDVIVKNVNPNSGLEKLGFEDYKEGEQWDNHSRYDDNTFPQQVVDVEEGLSLRGGKYARLREEVNRFNRENETLAIQRGYSPEEFDRMLSLWASQMAEKSGLDRDELIRSHEMFRDPDFLFSKQKVIHGGTGNIIGLLGFSRINNYCLGHNLMLNDFSIRGSCRSLQYEAVRVADAEGYILLNIQGSEDENQHKSKRKFRASTEIPKKHMVWRARK